jgi:hypothetical protein
MGKGMFEKRKTNYLSDIDKFLNNFDKDNESSSKSQMKEVKKFDNIKSQQIKDMKKIDNIKQLKD